MSNLKSILYIVFGIVLLLVSLTIVFTQPEVTLERESAQIVDTAKDDENIYNNEDILKIFKIEENKIVFNVICRHSLDCEGKGDKVVFEEGVSFGFDIPTTNPAWSLRIIEELSDGTEVVFTEYLDQSDSGDGRIFILNRVDRTLSVVDSPIEYIGSETWGRVSPDNKKLILLAFLQSENDDGYSGEGFYVFDLGTKTIRPIYLSFSENQGLFINDGQGLSAEIRWFDEETIIYGIYQDVPGRYWREKVGEAEITI